MACAAFAELATFAGNEAACACFLEFLANDLPVRAILREDAEAVAKRIAGIRVLPSRGSLQFTAMSRAATIRRFPVLAVGNSPTSP